MNPVDESGPREAVYPGGRFSGLAMIALAAAVATLPLYIKDGSPYFAIALAIPIAFFGLANLMIRLELFADGLRCRHGFLRTSGCRYDDIASVLVETRTRGLLRESTIQLTLKSGKLLKLKLISNAERAADEIQSRIGLTDAKTGSQKTGGHEFDIG